MLTGQSVPFRPPADLGIGRLTIRVQWGRSPVPRVSPWAVLSGPFRVALPALFCWTIGVPGIILFDLSGIRQLRLACPNLSASPTGAVVFARRGLLQGLKGLGCPHSSSVIPSSILLAWTGLKSAKLTGRPLCVFWDFHLGHPGAGRVRIACGAAVPAGIRGGQL